jgi:WD40-like Beta Propeller Repeat
MTRLRAPRILAALGLAALGLAACCALAGPAPSDADVFGPISLASAGLTAGTGHPQQADYAHDPAISGDGRYVAFDGSFDGVSGVWRRDLITGEVVQVAGGDAEMPSISEEGRYVSFTTNEGRALASITNGMANVAQQEAVNVYVRDMARQPAASAAKEEARQPAERAFVVASAANGSEEPLTYPAGSTTVGSIASGRTALSAEGREVVFVTTAVSDLSDPQTPSEPTTPALQVAVRYLDTKQTKLVSVDRETGGPVSATEGGSVYGAVFAGAGTIASFAPPQAYGGTFRTQPPPGASISADGSTVAWLGADVGEQAPLLPAESRAPYYTEPLLRRIAPGSETPTERVTGGSDPQAPGCAASGEAALPVVPSQSDPCQGPFAASGTESPSGMLLAGGGGDFVPQLSADGYTVAFTVHAPLVALSEFLGSSGESSDLYVADMRSGRTRDEALTPLTEVASRGGSAATAGPIIDFGISPDGGEVAFSTRRTQFPLGSPAYVTAPAAEAGMDELFDVDLRDNTLTRVTNGFEGGPGERAFVKRPISGEDPYEDGDGSLSPSFSANGDLLAFSSTASNLTWGDGNTPSNPGYGVSGLEDGSDAFVVERRQFGVIPTPQYLSPPDEELGVQPAWQLGVTAVSRKDGSVLLYVRTPAPGAVRAAAQSAVLVRVVRSSRGARRAHTTKRGRKPHVRTKLTVAQRTVATTRAQSRGAGVLSVVLKLANPYQALAARRGGLSGSVGLSFAAGAHVLRQSVQVTFVRTVKHRARRRSPAKHKKKKGHAR